jgi:ABC-type transporter Mla subunit MlaD
VRRIVAIALALVALVGGAAVVAGAGGPTPGTRTYHLVFDNAFGLVEGGDFRVGGVRAGQTTKFSIETSRTGPPKAIVTATVNRNGIAPLRRDARCTIRPQSLVGEYFVDCQPGSSKRELPDGGTVPLANDAGTIPQDLVLDVLRRPARERLRLFIATLGTGLAGRPHDVQAVLRRSWPGLRETRRTLAILGAQNQTIRQFVTDADTVVSRLESRSRDVTDFIHESRGTAETAATRREGLRQATRRLPAFLAELKPSMAQLSALARQGGPLATELRTSAPDATALLRQVAPFSRASLPALRKLGDAARPATQALRSSDRELATLRHLGSQAPATAKPLRQLLQSLDDRRHAVDTDARALATQPPAPDPTHVNAGGGFTGFESLANYFFWQTMTTNGFDAIGHQLRVGATVSKCSPYRNAPPSDADSQKLFADCNSWLGPHQPGINAPDPSVPGSTAAKASDRAAKPKTAVTPGVKDLMRPAAHGAAPKGSDDTSALDFLLGP